MERRRNIDAVYGPADVEDTGTEDDVDIDDDDDDSNDDDDSGAAVDDGGGGTERRTEMGAM